MSIKVDTIIKIKESKIVPVFYHSDLEVCKQVVKACYEAGLKVFEFTNRGTFAHETFAALNRYVLEELPGFELGAGSIVDAPTAALYMQNGASFIVSPLLNAEIGKICNRRKIVWIPGCATVTEIGNAHELGADIIKIFPAAQLGGPEFVKAVKAPCPWTDIMVTGGVQPTEENLRSWFDAGVCSVGIGSALFKKEWLEAGDYKKIKTAISEAMAFIK
ncbi:bifunctional 4-hydroxy-2-oxoglutarate aldolase/2-dehydro-3-deoxy-phosphogluconate aldolase [Zhouia amylolytica]|uniref:bifunctional 4-hydroxy-2-oxoglutarate aldolase/2-dehydro-3-deoxy-phosphogluconate aldolase n=1 Tax=Zhouia amylolytica TaxID=376730 RepID=UPI0020CCADD0|nr:bifunctional 4-hydroxy-2-oxoglutarate aldolase/2-dehydro-3-deoxy-phosphogluconate aldolase [Zhouia amylolytica]MCQ0111827.1 bifunctional 4-hydroxy-2-oxoglutarate aldolase/2-dehydro-3-deoxy-phosphogluconate aldolase [Zhouia amylolytica]